jgi:hypothetical protein
MLGSPAACSGPAPLPAVILPAECPRPERLTAADLPLYDAETEFDSPAGLAVTLARHNFLRAHIAELDGALDCYEAQTGGERHARQ